MLVFPLLLVTGNAHATEFVFRDVVDFGAAVCPEGQTGAVPLTLSLDFDPATPGNALSPERSDYTLGASSVSLGGVDYTCVLNNVAVEDWLFDRLDISCGVGPGSYINFSFVDTTGTAFDSTDLPQQVMAPTSTTTTTASRDDFAGTSCSSSPSNGTATMEEALAPRIVRMTDTANAAYGSTVVSESASDARLRPSVITAQLQQALDALADGGCTNGAQPFGHAAGAFAYSNGNGVDEHGPISGGNYRSTSRTWGYVANDGTAVGNRGGLDSMYTAGGKLIAERGDGGAQVGRWVRVAGRRGIWVTASAECDLSGGSPMPTLEAWASE